MNHKSAERSPVFLGAVATGLLVTFWSVRTPLDCIIGLAAVTCLVLMARVELGALMMRLRPFMFFAALTMVFGGLQRDGHALFFSCRLLLLGAMTVWLTRAIGVSSLIGWLRRVSHGLRRFHIDLSPVLTTMALSMTLLPVLQDEARRITLGLAARGGRIYGAGPIARLRLLPGLIIPLLAAALRRAGHLADALDVRAQGSQGVLDGMAVVVGKHEGERGGQAGVTIPESQTVQRGRFTVSRWVTSVVLAWSIVLIRIGYWVLDMGLGRAIA